MRTRRRPIGRDYAVAKDAEDGINANQVSGVSVQVSGKVDATAYPLTLNLER
jgi:hypothetical protein